jgi:DNA-binding transcriptional LysR family regulator
MPDIAPPSLDHLRVFLCVVEEGSFNAAARKLGRATSVVSYAIAQLETHLDVTLFEREGSRRPQLTREGQALLSGAHAVSDGVDALLAKVRSLRQGLEAELAVAIDVMFPGDALASVLRGFQQRFPTVPLRLHVEALGAVPQMVLEQRAMLAVSGPAFADLPGLDMDVIGAVELVPVAAPSHPLTALGRIEPGETRRHMQLVLTDRSTLSEGRDYSVFSAHTWRIADLGAKHALLKEGIGWGSMPRHLVAGDIAGGALVELRLPERPALAYDLVAMWRKDSPPGPAAHWMLEALREQLARCPAPQGRLHADDEAPTSPA